MNTSKRIMNILFVAALILALVPVGSGFAEGTLVTDGYDKTADLKAGVRFRNFNLTGSQAEAFLGNPDCFSGTCDPNYKKDINLTKWPTSNHFILEYIPQDEVLYLTLNGSTTLQTMGNLGDLNYIRIDLKSNARKTKVNLNNLSINTVEPDRHDFSATGNGIK